MIAIGSDHRGYELKNFIIEALGSENIIDYGTFSKEICDYPDIAFPLAEDVRKGVCDKGILICSNGVGMSICANKVKTIRCALCFNKKMAKFAKRDDDVNIITIPSDYVTKEEALEIISEWQNTKFEGGRYERRVNKIKDFEEG